MISLQPFPQTEHACMLVLLVLDVGVTISNARRNIHIYFHEFAYAKANHQFLMAMVPEM
jgi:hypothetical protein